MGLDVPDRPTKCPAPGMVVIRVIDMVLMIDQTKVPIGKFHIVDIPDVFCVVADQSHIIGIRYDHREILSIYCL